MTSQLKIIFCLVCLLGFSNQSSALEAFRFLAFGDMPYVDKDYTLLADADLDDSSFPFAVFYGDMKRGSGECTAEIYSKNSEFIFGLTQNPIFAALGDNGWTDCDRKGGDELEKLKEVRTAMYAPDYLPSARLPNSEGWGFQSLANYPEIMRWAYGGVKFSTFHIVGTNNGRTEINCHIQDNRGAMEKAALDAVDQRDAANRQWLNTVFDEARASDSAAVVLVMQVDPTADMDARKYVYADDYDTKCPYKPGAPKFSEDELAAFPPCDTETRTRCNPYATFFEALKARTADFGKPVLMIHGSTYDVCVQNGFLGEENLTRLNGPGDGVQDLAFVTVAEDDSGIGFDFTSYKTGNRLTQACP